jgi:hypothetical protein
MAICKKGARRIVVDGQTYLWSVRRKPTYSQGLAESNLTGAVQLDSPDAGSVLVIDAGQPRPDNWMGRTERTITPAEVSRCIREAQNAGWRPEVSGRPFGDEMTPRDELDRLLERARLDPDDAEARGSEALAGHPGRARARRATGDVPGHRSTPAACREAAMKEWEGRGLSQEMTLGDIGWRRSSGRKPGRSVPRPDSREADTRRGPAGSGIPAATEPFASVPKAVSVTYKLTGRGWAECSVEIGDRSACLTASYLSDALGDLVGALVVLLQGAPESTVAFAEEPGEYQWRFRRLPQDRVSTQIVWHCEWPAARLADGDREVMQAECRLRTLAGAVLAASQQVIGQWRDEGYQRQWVNHPFPRELQKELKRLLDQGAGRGPVKPAPSEAATKEKRSEPIDPPA